MLNEKRNPSRSTHHFEKLKMVVTGCRRRRFCCGRHRSVLLLLKNRFQIEASFRETRRFLQLHYYIHALAADGHFFFFCFDASRNRITRIRLIARAQQHNTSNTAQSLELLVRPSKTPSSKISISSSKNKTIHGQLFLNPAPLATSLLLSSVAFLCALLCVYTPCRRLHLRLCCTTFHFLNYTELPL